MDTTETLLGRKPAFVLVPGSWCGAWCWKPVADRLRNAGHTVFPMSLTGLAERSQYSVVYFTRAMGSAGL